MVLKSTFAPIHLASREVVGWSSFHIVSGGTLFIAELTPTLKVSDDYM